MRASVTNSLARSLWLPLSQPPTVPNLYRKPHPYPPTILNLALLLDSHSHRCSRSQLVSSTTSPFHSRHSALPSTSLSTPPGTHSLLASSLTSCSLAWQQRHFVYDKNGFNVVVVSVITILETRSASYIRPNLKYFGGVENKMLNLSTAESRISLK